MLDENDIERISLIDTEDLPKFELYNGQFYPFYCPETDSYYLMITIYNKKRTKPLSWAIRGHKIALDYYGTGYDIDHINHDTLDNRKENLRFASKGENTKNRKAKNSNNKSGYRNVCWLKDYKKWVVQIMIDGKNTRVGFFDDVDEAGAYAEKMRQKYYGEFAGNT